MARSINRLSPRLITTLSDKGRYADGGGLYLQVGPTGGKSWLFRFKLDGRARQMGLGAFPTISLAEARQKAVDCRRMLVDGIDPINKRESEKLSAKIEEAKTRSFRECAEAYLKSHRPAWKNAKHFKQWESTLATYVYPIFGELPVAAVDTGLVTKVLEPIWTTKTETAGRVRGRIENILDWAIAREYRSKDNPARWKGHLDKILPSRRKVSKVKHLNALPYAELPSFIQELRQQSGVAAQGLEFVILTACRTSEVLGARFDEIDEENRTWTIPAERMKADREHRVPLSKRAFGIFFTMKSLRTSDFLFPGANLKRPLSNMAFLQLLKRMGRSDVTVHGFRSTFRDWAAECTSFPREVAEMALAHTISNKVEAAYRRGDLFEKRQDLMNAWASYCNGGG